MPGLIESIKTRFINLFLNFNKYNERRTFEKEITKEFLTEISEYDDEDHCITFDCSSLSDDDFSSLITLFDDFYIDDIETIETYAIEWLQKKYQIWFCSKFV